MTFGFLQYSKAAAEARMQTDEVIIGFEDAKNEIKDYQRVMKLLKDQHGDNIIVIESLIGKLADALFNVRELRIAEEELARATKDATEAQKLQKRAMEESMVAFAGAFENFDKFTQALDRKMQIDKASNEADKTRLELTFKLMDSIAGLADNQAMYNSKLEEGKRKIEEYVRSIDAQTAAIERLTQKSRTGGFGGTGMDTSHFGNLTADQIAAIEANDGIPNPPVNNTQ